MSVTAFVVAASASARDRVRRLLAGAGVPVVGDGVSPAAARAAAGSDVIVAAGSDLLDDWPQEETENQVALIVLSGDPDTVGALQGMDLPGWAVLPPDASGEEIRAAAILAAAGLTAMPLEAAGRHLLEVTRRRMEGHDEEELPAGEALTAREREVLVGLADGLSNREIAAALAISEHTAKFHVASVLAKLGAVNRADAVRKGLRRGLLTL